MIVYLLLREDQNDHGYIDVTVNGVFHQKSDAARRLHEECDQARKEGLRICDDDEGSADWQVFWKIEDYPVE